MAVKPNRPLAMADIDGMRFEFAMHMNRGRFHDRVTCNQEWGLAVSTTSDRRRGYRITERVLYVTAKPEIQVDLMAEKKAVRDALRQFVLEFNEWRATR